MNLWSAESRTERIFRILRDLLIREFITFQINKKEKITEDMMCFDLEAVRKY